MKLRNKTIRLADVLGENARLYEKDFEKIEEGTEADLVFSIDDKEITHRICLHQGLSPSNESFDFQRI